jgi:hypothetical protein
LQAAYRKLQQEVGQVDGMVTNQTVFWQSAKIESRERAVPGNSEENLLVSFLMTVLS